MKYSGGLRNTSLQAVFWGLGIVSIIGVTLVACGPASETTTHISPKLTTRATQLRNLSSTDPLMVLPTPESNQAPVVDLWNDTGATTRFATHNGQAHPGLEAEWFDLPYLVLFRNGEPTDPHERTIHLVVRNIAVASTGAEVTIVLATQHSDPDTVGCCAPIQVWRESRWISPVGSSGRSVAAVSFDHTFEPAMDTGARTMQTPTDYYRVRVTISEGDADVPVHGFEVDYAFLLENVWTVRLPALSEETAGAAPRELLVHYCDMFPFRHDAIDRSTWLPRQAVTTTIADRLVPAMIDAIQLQSDRWGFTWHSEWTSCRVDTDPKQLSVALGDGTTWYHGTAPCNANMEISITVNGNDLMHYDTLADGIIADFQHELFHNLQRDIRQHLTGDGDIDGASDAWAFFTEGTAIVAASVAQPDIQFAFGSGRRMYMVQANNFLGRIDQAGGHLDSSYASLSPYLSALYWRFLVERCSGAALGAENPAAGMAIIRHALEALYSGEVVDIDTSTGLIGALPAILDRALTVTPACPFRTFEESRREFAKTLYSLRLKGSRCTEPGQPAGCVMYDPEQVYEKPIAYQIVYDGKPLTYAGYTQLHPAAIEASYGMDFVNIEVTASRLDAGPVRLEIKNRAGTAAVFDVQVWALDDSSGVRRLAAEVAEGIAGANHPFITVLQADPDTVSRYAVLLLRQDPDEAKDPRGLYTISLSPGP